MTVTHICPASARLLPKALPKGGAVIPAAAESETGGSSSLPLGFFEVAFFMGFYMRLPRLPLLRWQQHASQPLLWIQAPVVASRFYKLLYLVYLFTSYAALRTHPTGRWDVRIRDRCASASRVSS